MAVPLGADTLMNRRCKETYRPRQLPWDWGHCGCRPAIFMAMISLSVPVATSLDLNNRFPFLLSSRPFIVFT